MKVTKKSFKFNKILKHRYNDKTHTFEYHVQWKYSKKTTWEPSKCFNNKTDIVEYYNGKYFIVSVYDFNKKFNKKQKKEAIALFCVKCELYDLVCIKIRNNTLFTCAEVIRLFNIKCAF